MALIKKYLIQLLHFLFKRVFGKLTDIYYVRRWTNGRFKSIRNTDVKPRILFTPVPILNNKYWATALKKIGYKADTLMYEFYAINTRSDFDYYIDELKQKYATGLTYKLFFALGAGDRYLSYSLFEHCFLNYDLFVIPFTGGILAKTPLKNEEARILKEVGCKTLIFAYGEDYFQYSKILDPSYRHAILSNYPEMARKEHIVNSNYHYWAVNADFIMGSMAHDGLGRWDMLPVNFITIDTEKWRPKFIYSNHDGKNGIVKITHSPNHRYVKGTEYILDAVNQLKNEGLKIEFILIEKKTNEEVREILETASDIHIEQIIYCGYALSAIEGMACGLPVISNEENEITTRVLRRYSFLNECPVLSSSPEKIKQSLSVLIKNPDLREQLGKAGRSYVEKYHSEKSAQHMFEKIVEKVWSQKDINLMSEYHPMNKSGYNNQSPKVEHPLFENKIPESLLNTLNQ